MAKRKNNATSKLFKLLIVLALFTGVFYFLKFKSRGIDAHTYVKSSFKLERTQKNYGTEVDRLSKEFNLPSDYLKALITLECSGRKEFEPRFERHVYTQLKKVRDRHTNNFGSITNKIIHNASDGALKNLATSWGPFQLMGYQCIELGVNLQDIRGKDALYWGIYWINKQYGKRLRRNEFQDAFHIHNTGKPFPKNGISKTHDPNYIKNGLEYLQYFSMHRNDK